MERSVGACRRALGLLTLSFLVLVPVLVDLGARPAAALVQSATAGATVRGEPGQHTDAATQPAEPTAQSARAQLNDRLGDSPMARLVSIIMLWSHALLGGLWLALMGLLAVLTLPRPPLLAPSAVERIWRRGAVLANSALVVSAVLIATGIWNIVRQTPYKDHVAPSSSLPYATPYTISLWAKIGLYGLLLLLSVPIIKKARALTSRTLALSRAGVSDEVASSPALTVRSRLTLAMFAVGASGIGLAVVLVKFFHVMTLRALSGG